MGGYMQEPPRQPSNATCFICLPKRTEKCDKILVDPSCQLHTWLKTPDDWLLLHCLSSYYYYLQDRKQFEYYHICIAFTCPSSPTGMTQSSLGRCFAGELRDTEPRESTDLYQTASKAHLWPKSYIVVVVVLSLSCVRLFATLWTIGHQAPLSMGFSRQEYWSRLPFPSPGDLPNSGTEPMSPALQAGSLPLSHLGSPQEGLNHIP